MLLTKNNRNCCEFDTYAIRKARKVNVFRGLQRFLVPCSWFLVLRSWFLDVIYAERETPLMYRGTQHPAPSTKNEEPRTKNEEPTTNPSSADAGNRVPYLVEQFPFNQESIIQGTDQHGVRCLRCRKFTRRYSSKD